jgi:hypothetical protein
MELHNAEQTGRPRLQSPPATGVNCSDGPFAPGWRFAVRAAGYRRRCDASPAGVCAAGGERTGSRSVGRLVKTTVRPGGGPSAAAASHHSTAPKRAQRRGRWGGRRAPSREKKKGRGERRGDGEDGEIDVSLEIDLDTFEDVSGIESEDEMVD